MGAPQLLLLSLLLPGCAPEKSKVPTWYQDVQPIVETRCGSCHRPELNDIQFTNAEVAVAYAARMGVEIRAGRMPPASPDPSCRSYAHSDELDFPEAEREAILAWADGGAPLGDPETQVHGPPLQANVEPDLFLDIGTPHLLDFNSDTQYLRCYNATLDNAEEVWLTSLTVVPGDGKNVHHVVLFQVLEGENVPQIPGGALCDDYGAFQRQIVAGWAGGSWPVAFPDGTALRVPPHGQFIFQIHYEGEPEDSGKEALTRVGLTVSSPPEHPLTVLDNGGPDFVVPAGDSSYSSALNWTWEGPQALHVVTAGGHMHQLGRELHMWHHGKDGEECMIDASPWDFHRQVFLTFDEAVVYQPGDAYGWTCTWDNSESSLHQYNFPPLDVYSGFDVYNEMCTAASFGWLE